MAHKAPGFAVRNLFIRDRVQYRLRLVELTLLKTAILTSNQDLDPAMASRKQHEVRLYRLEFQVQKFLYDAV